MKVLFILLFTFLQATAGRHIVFTPANFSVASLMWDASPYDHFEFMDGLYSHTGVNIQVKVPITLFGSTNAEITWTQFIFEANVTIRGLTFSDAYPALAFYSGDNTVQNTVFRRNHIAIQIGGGFSSVFIQNCSFILNTNSIRTLTYSLPFNYTISIYGSIFTRDISFGIYTMDSNVNLIIANSQVYDNNYFFRFERYGNNVKLTNCQFWRHNMGQINGANMIVESSSFERCTISSSNFYAVHSQFTESTLSFSGNTTFNNCTGTYGSISFNNGPVSISDCRFVNNTYGGALNFNRVSSISISNSVFLNNSAGIGGAILVSESTAFLSNIICGGNTALGGGGGCVHSYKSAIIVNSSFIFENTANNGGGIEAIESSFHIISSNISRNIATTHGGGFYSERRPIDSSNSKIESCFITENVAMLGGGIGIEASDSNVVIQGSIIAGNLATNCGGMFSKSSGEIYTIRSKVVNNTAQGNGGGICAYSSKVFFTSSSVNNNNAVTGGGFFLDNSGSAFIVDCTIVSNNAISESAMFFSNIGESWMRNTTIQTNTSEYAFCCNNAKTTSPNEDICSFPICSSGCMEADGCNCPFTTPVGTLIGEVLFPSVCTCDESHSGNRCEQYNCSFYDPCKNEGTCYSTPFGEQACDCGSGLIYPYCDNECEANATACPDAMNCFYVGNSHHICCNHGFTVVDSSCTDINECEQISVCPAGTTCFNTNGSHMCCSSGFTLVNSSCSDINECDFTECPDSTQCFNTIGSFLCCPYGFTIQNFSCVDIDECKGENQCSINAKCHNFIGGYNCTCHEGFLDENADGFTCTDIDECKNENKCSLHSTCSNYAGGYNCTCRTGYQDISSGQGFNCTDINECEGENQCSINAKCHNFFGGYNCTCQEGFSDNGDGFNCTDIDECTKENKCSLHSTCSNFDGGYNCTCHTGYQDKNGEGFNCTDIDECAKENKCSLHSTCLNYGGGYNCTCHTGYQDISGEGFNCTDKNECESSSACPASMICYNTNGSHVCCPSGFTLLNSSCTDINECDLTACPSSTNCFNINGSFLCCPFGFTMINSSCVDIDECQLNSSACNESMVCFNTNGSHSCCPQGFVLIDSECVDVDECKTNSSACPATMSCFNSPGSYSCCPMGFILINSTCEDINECEFDSTVCSNSTCFNTKGSFSCCPQGFTLINSECVDIDECKTNSSSCPASTSCFNSPGSFSCCPKGFTFINSSCQDINECELNPTVCRNSTTCFNTKGSFSCCPIGFILIGSRCHGIDCSVNNGGCDYHTKCTSFNGDKICGECPFGYNGTGYLTCEKLCGDGTCDPNLLENCVSCPQDCRLECDACGDQICRNNETCSSCPEDCGTCAPKSCPACSANGRCIKGVCECSDNWRGPTCSESSSEIITVLINSTIPSVIIQPIKPTSQPGEPQKQISFGISVVRLVEMNENNEEVNSVSLLHAELNYTYFETNIGNSSNLMWIYSSNLENGASVNLTFLQFNENFTDYSFYNDGSDNTTFPANTLKFNFRVSLWPFNSISNSLHVQMESSVKQQEKDNIEIDPGIIGEQNAGDVKWLSIPVDDLQLYAKFSPQSIVDGRKRTTRFAYGGQTTVFAVLPHFWEFSEFDPSYSVLVNTQDSTEEGEEEGLPSGVFNNNYTLIIGVTVGAVFAVAIITGAVVLSRKRRKTAVFETKLKKAKKQKMEREREKRDAVVLD